MHNISALEACYQKYINTIQDWPSECITEVDLELLKKFDLLSYYNMDQHDPSLTQYFHVVESPEKITLINEKFVIWIVPQKSEGVPFTCTMIALNQSDNVKLELAFITTGVYNNSRLVLRVLEKYLFEIQENEDLISDFTG